MNKVNFSSNPNFPFSIKTFEFLQGMSLALNNLVSLGGDNYILNGCVENNNTISDGFLVINGELLPFVGATITENIVIVDTKENTHAFGVTYTDAYVTRYATFSVDGTIPWASIKRILTNQQLSDRIEGIKGDPPGIRVSWCGLLDRIPDNYMLCDGRTLNILDYPELYQNIGTNFGAVGTTQFKLPDMRSKFVVGYNDTEIDYNVIGKQGGDKEVVLTKNQLPEHNHVPNNSLFDKFGAKASDLTGGAGTTGSSQDSSGATEEYRIGDMSDSLWNLASVQNVGQNQSHENRPPYFVEAFIIKVKY